MRSGLLLSLGHGFGDIAAFTVPRADELHIEYVSRHGADEAFQFLGQHVLLESSHLSGSGVVLRIVRSAKKTYDRVLMSGCSCDLLPYIKVNLKGCWFLALGS